MSRDVKRSLFEDKQNTLQELPQTAAAEKLAKQQCQLFQHLEEPDHGEELVLPIVLYGNIWVFWKYNWCYIKRITDWF